ncbi:MAG TPA: hypothetical protein VME86_07750 [Acidobacteriaceae bacterium]|nr:hypothetical protein [Acidobacteriaceae bacterium]
MKWTQLKYLTAMMLIGDGVLAMLRPYRDAMTWDMGPAAWKALMCYLSEHPDTLRAIGAAEVALGFALIASNGSAEEQQAEREAAARAQIKSIA